MRFLCPICKSDLAPQARTWACTNGHAFDVAREGYVNLLPVQHKHSRDPGDAPPMVAARRAFLDAGHYAPLREAVRETLHALNPQTVLDLGCGEGYYTAAMREIAPEVVGLDIAKDAVRQAARRYRQPGLVWMVASNAHLPLADASVDAVCCLFVPLHPAELQRVVRPHGHLLLVTPAPDHLLELRAELFEDVRTHAPEKFTATLEAAGFDAVESREVRVPLHLEPIDLRHLLAMTPYAWRARPDARAALEAREVPLDTQAAFALQRFRRRAAQTATAEPNTQQSSPSTEEPPSS